LQDVQGEPPGRATPIEIEIALEIGMLLEIDFDHDFDFDFDSDPERPWFESKIALATQFIDIDSRRRSRYRLVTFITRRIVA
jgi:hypothetical protein